MSEYQYYEFLAIDRPLSFSEPIRKPGFYMGFVHSPYSSLRFSSRSKA